MKASCIIVMPKHTYEVKAFNPDKSQLVHVEIYTTVKDERHCIDTYHVPFSDAEQVINKIKTNAERDGFEVKEVTVQK